MVAVILGTGTNACYVERTDAIPKLPGKKLSHSGTTVSQNLIADRTRLASTLYKFLMFMGSVMYVSDN